LASHEIKQQGKRRNISLSITAKRLADFLANVHEHEALLLQRLKDLEGQQVRAALTRKSLLAPDSTEATSQVPLDEKRKISEPFIPVAVAPVDLSQLTVLEEYR
jgi:putative transposase